jgi:DNA-binding response OmpR family regulator
MNGEPDLTETRRRVLVIEDDPETASQLVDFLRTRGYEVDLARNGHDGLRLASASSFAVMTIDRMLPGVDGLSVIRKLRESGIDTPALIVSALSEVDDRVRGLRGGGDDYLVKPFAFVELLARVRVLLRRGQPTPERLQVGDLSLDCIRRKVTRAGENIELAPKEFSILEYLMRNRGRPMSRTMIVEHVWDMDYDGLTNIVDVYIRHLRSKIDEKWSDKMISTVRGIGYMLDSQERPVEKGI